MKIIKIGLKLLAFILVTCVHVEASNLIYQENFEDNNGSDTYGTAYLEYWQTHLSCTEVVMSNPHTGQYSFRGSISEIGTADEITGEPGCRNPRTALGIGPTNHGNTSDFDVSIIDTGEFFISWWVRFDPGEIVNLSSDSHKMMYVYTSVPDNYLILQLKSHGGLRLIVNADNVAGYPYTAGDDSSNNYQYGYNLGSFHLDDGNWHHVKFFADWGSGGGADSILRLWVDSKIILDVDNAVALYRDSDRVVSLAVPANISNSQSTDVSSVGWQVDDIEIWDGIPEEGMPEPPYLYSPVSKE